MMADIILKFFMNPDLSRKGIAGVRGLAGSGIFTAGLLA